MVFFLLVIVTDLGRVAVSLASVLQAASPRLELRDRNEVLRGRSAVADAAETRKSS